MIVTPTYSPAQATCRLDVIVTLSGVLTSAGAYLLPWFASAADPTSTVNGFGLTSDPAFAVPDNRLQWMIAAAALAAAALIVVRVTGRSDHRWRPAATVVCALAVFGAAFSLAAVPDGMVRAPGVWVAAAGATTLALGVVLMRRQFANG